MKQTQSARIARIEYATYVNTLLIASHIGAAAIPLLWIIFVN